MLLVHPFGPQPGPFSQLTVTYRHNVTSIFPRFVMFYVLFIVLCAFVGAKWTLEFPLIE